MADPDDILAGLNDVLGGTNLAASEVAPMKPRRVKRAVLPVTVPVEAEAPLDCSLTHHGFCGERVRIVIERGHDPTDLPYVFLKLNDYNCRITRGEEVDIPIELLGVLDDAEQRGFSQPVDGILVPHDSLRFPYRLVTGHEHLRVA